MEDSFGYIAKKSGLWSEAEVDGGRGSAEKSEV